MSDPTPVEREFGVPFPGRVLPPDKWTQTALKAMPEAGHLNWRELFGREAPVVLDLGCGNGRSTILGAISRPTYDHLGTDILPVVIRYARKRGNQRGLTNLKFAVLGAHELLDKFVEPGSVSEIQIYHPQPYYDAKLVHRRLITPAFLSLVHRSLVHRSRATVIADTPIAPAASSAVAHAESVAPVVRTSSTSTTHRPRMSGPLRRSGCT